MFDGILGGLLDRDEPWREEPWREDVDRYEGSESTSDSPSKVMVVALCRGRLCPAPILMMSLKVVAGKKSSGVWMMWGVYIECKREGLRLCDNE